MSSRTDIFLKCGAVALRGVLYVRRRRQGRRHERELQVWAYHDACAASPRGVGLIVRALRAWTKET